MPLMLPDDETASAWIEADADPGKLSELLHPPAIEAIEAYPVSRRVNKPESDEPACVARASA